MAPARKAKESAQATGVPAPALSERWRFCLYIAGRTPKSAVVLANLKALCATRLPAGCDIQIVDILRNPAAAIAGQIVAVPTLVRSFPLPPRRLAGTLTNTQRVLTALDLA